MDGSLLIGAPIGLGVLLAAGIVMVVMSYLTNKDEASRYMFVSERLNP